jgi:uncharacterized membrane protein YedE/YeeE
MSSFTPMAATLGGLLIGAAASMLLLFNGRIAGVSGTFWRALDPGEPERAVRFAFLGGLVAGGVLLRFVDPSAFASIEATPRGLSVAAGLLVGFGTRFGSGCTSGHGICGIARLSRRSIVATSVFMATGAAVVFATHHLGASP